MMRPPRTRTPRIDLSNIDVLRALILNTTALLITLMIARLPALMVPGSDSGTVPRLIKTISTPFVWPFSFIPPFNIEIFAGITLIDVLIVPVIAFSGLLIAGIVTGWRDSTADRRRHPAFEE
ncbi:MAG: hypothetical protein EA415_05150 [Sphaerobacteraceae bacterium]|nr:MAG: hypothetical protein EA415_05150 [Sphaerobacteraceae bacterium]